MGRANDRSPRKQVKYWAILAGGHPPVIFGGLAAGTQILDAAAGDTKPAGWVVLSPPTPTRESYASQESIAGVGVPALAGAVATPRLKAELQPRQFSTGRRINTTREPATIRPPCPILGEGVRLPSHAARSPVHLAASGGHRFHNGNASDDEQSHSHALPAGRR